MITEKFEVIYKYKAGPGFIEHERRVSFEEKVDAMLTYENYRAMSRIEYVYVQRFIGITETIASATGAGV